ncbi:MAG: PfkB family carbohydrate kinase [Candidatus Woesebacteria bacterium]|nr:PfkB family carbohydrate kinase [Candidatus Woesebacteria bacterium]
MKIAVVGDIGIDYYENLNLLKPGGIAFNFAYNLKKSGVKNVSLVSVLGNDEYTKKLLAVLKKTKINSNNIQKISGNSPKQNIFLKKGERKFTGYAPEVLKNWKLRKKDIEFIKTQDAVFVPLNDGMKHIFDAIKKIDRVIKVVDFSQDSEFADFDKKENVITKNAKYFDIIFVGGKKKHQKLIQSLSEKYSKKVFVLTLGKSGSIGFLNKSTINQSAYKINRIVDTTGCGDAFQAGFLASWIKKKNIKTALQSGTKRASSIIKHVGSTPLILK